MSEEKQPSRFFYDLTRLVLLFLFKILYKVSISGMDNIPESGGVILVANHTSFLDPPLLAMTTRRQVFFLAKEELFRVPILGTFMKWLCAIPVNRDKVSLRVLRMAIDLLGKQQALGIFPEGKRQRLGHKKLGPLLTGAAYMAIKSGSQIVPVGISGTDRVVPTGTYLPRFPKIRANVGKPILVDKDKTSSEKLDELTKTIEQAIIDLIE